MSILLSRWSRTLNIVNWDALSEISHRLHQVESSHWGMHSSGGYNLVRFLHLHNTHNTILVVRVPLRPLDCNNMNAEFHSIKSEVATMQYLESRTTTPVPHVFHHSAETEGEVRSPYILMSKIEGVSLFSVWNDMDDDKRRAILRQIVDILLELWSHRFDKRGPLFRRADGEWYVDPSISLDTYGSNNANQSQDTSASSSADMWLAQCDAELHKIRDSNFGATIKPFSYPQSWFIRSLIPSLFDPSFDLHGFPITPFDFHSQNILITDVDKANPRITGIIDWEFSDTDFVTTFAQYPLFILDNPEWGKNLDMVPLRERNVRDQVTFDELLREAERNRSHTVGGFPLSHFISNSYPIYLFQQIVGNPLTFSELYPLLFAYVFGVSDPDINEDEFDEVSNIYYSALDRGILKKDRERFEKEHERMWLRRN